MRTRIIGIVIGALLTVPYLGTPAHADPWEKIQPTYELVKCSVTAIQNGQSPWWTCFHPS